MKLNNILELSNLESSFYNNYKKKECKEFKIPFKNFEDLFFYVDLGTTAPTSIDYYIYNVDMPLLNSTTATDYVIGFNGTNYYAVITGIDNQNIQNLALVVKANYPNSVVDYFATDQYYFCSNASKLEVCYGANYGKYDGYFDKNGVYYGYPSQLISGNINLKYSHVAYLYDEVITTDTTKTFTNTIVNNTVANTNYVYEGVIGNIDGSEYYINHIESILSRGQLTYNGKSVIVESFVSSKDCCGLSILGKTKYTNSIEYNCNCNDAIPCEAPIIGEVIVDTNLNTATVNYTANGVVEYRTNGIFWTTATASPIVFNILSYPTTIYLRSVCGDQYSSVVSRIITNGSGGSNAMIIVTNITDITYNASITDITVQGGGYNYLIINGSYPVNAGFTLTGSIVGVGTYVYEVSHTANVYPMTLNTYLNGISIDVQILNTAGVAFVNVSHSIGDIINFELS
jgi:hypothetical protein